MMNIGLVATQSYVPAQYCPLKHLLALPHPVSWGDNAALAEAVHEERLLMHGVSLRELETVSRIIDVRHLTTETGIDSVAVEPSMEVSELISHVSKGLLQVSAPGCDVSGAIVCQTSLESDVTMSSACRIQSELRQGRTPFSVGQHQGASFLIALSVAADLMRSDDTMGRVILAAAERWSWPFPRVVGRTTVLGDGAGAFLLERASTHGWMLKAIEVATPVASLDIYRHIIVDKPFEVDIDALCSLIKTTLARASCQPQQIDLVAPHCINLQHVEQVLERCNIQSGHLDLHTAALRGYLCAAETPARVHEALQHASNRSGETLLTWGVGLSGALACAVFEYTAGGRDD